MRKLKKILCALCAALFIILPACGSQGERAENVALKKDGSLHIAIESDVQTLHPFDHSSVVCSYMNQMTFSKLFITDPETLKPVPELVESYGCSDDGLTWSFKLKEGVLFHNGQELTAADAVASLNYASTFAYCKRYTSFIKSLEQTGRYTFKIETHKPYALTLYDLSANSACVLPAELIAQGHDFAQEPVGCGPYILKERVLGDSITFERFDSYFDQSNPDPIKEITWRVIPEGSSRTIALETKEVGLVMDVAQGDVQRLMDTNGITVLTEKGTRINFMSMNSQMAPFDDINFRKGICSAVDREALCSVATSDTGMPACSPNPSVYDGATDELTCPYDPEKAAEYFSLSPYDPEGMEITCLCYSDETRRSAEVIQAYLSEFGINLKIETMDFAAFLSLMLDGNYQCAVAGYSSSNMLTYMKGLWHSGSIGASNSSRVSDDVLDGMIERAETLTDEAELIPALREICLYTNDLSLLLPLYTSGVVRAFDSGLKGVEACPTGYVAFQDLHY